MSFSSKLPVLIMRNFLITTQWFATLHTKDKNRLISYFSFHSNFNFHQEKVCGILKIMLRAKCAHGNNPHLTDKCSTLQSNFGQICIGKHKILFLVLRLLSEEIISSAYVSTHTLSHFHHDAHNNLMISEYHSCSRFYFIILRTSVQDISIVLKIMCTRTGDKHWA